MTEVFAIDGTTLDTTMAMAPYSRIKDVWTMYKEGTLDVGTTHTFRGRCETVRGAKAGRLLFIELCDGSTVKTLQCVCDSAPDDDTDPRHILDWTPLFEHCSRGATVELTGTVEMSPAGGQPIEFVTTSYKCLGKIDDPETYPLGQQSFLSRDFLRGIPDKRTQTMLFLAIQIIKQTTYRCFHEAMAHLNIGEIQPTIITGNECEEGAHPFTATTILDDGIAGIPLTEDGRIDWSKDFFAKQVYLTVSSQLHLEATVLGSKRDGYCMTTAFRAEPSDTTSHLAEFCMPEWEVIGGGLKRNMAIAQYTLQYIFRAVLGECADELEYLESYRRHEAVEEDPQYKAEIASLMERKDTIGKRTFRREMVDIKASYMSKVDTPSLIERLKKWSSGPVAVVSHKECVRRIQEAVVSGELDEEMLLGYGDDLSRAHEYWICEVIGSGMPVCVYGFPKKIKAFYMPIIEEEEYVFDDDGERIEHVEGYDLLIPGIGEVIGGSQRIDDAKELESRMLELGMSLDELDWYIQLRRDASLPHGGAGLGMGRLMETLTGITNIKDMQEFPRAYHLKCVA